MERLKRKLSSTGRHVTAESTSATSSSSFSDEFSEEELQQAKGTKRNARLIYTLRENPKKSCKLPDPAAVHGGESDTDQSQRRTKRSRRVAANPEPLSSLSDASPEDDAATIAMCLVMLSRGTWPNRRRSKEEEEEPKKQLQHRCEVCNKAFRSSQALGGHRVTHRKLNHLGNFRRKIVAADGEDGGEKIFECRYCFKVFASGQALGGHKRSHNGGVPSPEGEIRLIDLNLPAPEEEDDCSVVSDAETHRSTL